MLGTSPVSSRWIASRIASARALKAASDLWNKDNQYDSFCTRWGCARGQEHERKRQKRGKDAPVVVVLSPKHVHVEGDARGLRERLEHVRDHLGREVANLFPLQLQVAAEVGSRGDVEDGAREGLHPIQADGISHSAQKEANRYRERGERTSSSGAKPVPYRRIPLRSPSASLNASPTASAQSSAVWWSSTSKSPLHWIWSDMRPCLARA